MAAFIGILRRFQLRRQDYRIRQQTQAPEEASDSPTVVSSLSEAMILPSGLKATEDKVLRKPLRGSLT